MNKKERSVFDELLDELDSSLTQKRISNRLIEYMEKSKDRFKYFEDKSMKEKDILQGLKLFSTSNTCGAILEGSISRLREAKLMNENPTTLEKLHDILAVTIDLGKRLDNIFDGEGSKEFDVKKIRDISLTLQEEAEKKGLIEPLDEKILKTPKEIRESIIQRLTPE